MDTWMLGAMLTCIFLPLLRGENHLNVQAGEPEQTYYTSTNTLKVFPGLAQW